jgi:hypothetical protein
VGKGRGDREGKRRREEIGREREDGEGKRRR